jgi:hypothetical protein
MDKGKDPNKWLGLLKWSLSYSDGTKTTDCTAAPEDIAWLKHVFQEMTVNEVMIISICISNANNFN